MLKFIIQLHNIARSKQWSQPTHWLTGDQTIWGGGDKWTNNAVSFGHRESLHPLKQLQPSTARSKLHSGWKRKPSQNIKKVLAVCLSVSLYLAKSKSIWYVLLFFFLRQTLRCRAALTDTGMRWRKSLFHAPVSGLSKRRVQQRCDTTSSALALTGAAFCHQPLSLAYELICHNGSATGGCVSRRLKTTNTSSDPSHTHLLII